MPELPRIDYEARQVKALAKASWNRAKAERIVRLYLEALHHQGSPAAGQILRYYFKEKA